MATVKVPFSAKYEVAVVKIPPSPTLASDCRAFAWLLPSSDFGAASRRDESARQANVEYRKSPRSEGRIWCVVDGSLFGCSLCFFFLLSG